MPSLQSEICTPSATATALYPKRLSCTGSSGGASVSQGDLSEGSSVDDVLCPPKRPKKFHILDGSDSDANHQWIARSHCMS